MTREELIRNLEYTMEKYKNDRVDTFGTNIALMCKDVLDYLKEQESCEDEYIKVPKKALKYRTAGMVAYNAEWLKNHFDIERAVICGAQEPFMNKPCVAHQVCHEDKVKMLDKIKEYVDHIRNTGMGKKKSLEFIEKFIEGLKAKSEE